MRRSRLSLRSALGLIPYAAVSVLLIAPLAAQLLAGGSPPSSTVPVGPTPSGLEAALDGMFAPDVCHPATKAEAQVRALLASGYPGWAVRSTAVDPTDCVSWSMRQAGERIVTLLPTAGPDVIRAMADVQESSYQECLDRAQIVELVTARLVAAGASGFEVRSDGPFSFPLDRQDEVLAHYEAGCWVYSGYGWAGHFVFFVSGK
jgi:hypothetical protein